MNTSSPAIEFHEVAHSFGNLLVLDDFSLTIEKGEIVSLLGPSGCGKTTALRIAAGLERLQSGRVIIERLLAADHGFLLPPEKRSIGFVFQDLALFPHMTVADNVAFGLRGLKASKKEERVRETLHQVGMIDYLKAYPHMLSGGQQQRIALARAVAPQPKIVLLDEPFSGLDTKLRHQVREETIKFLKKNKATALMVTHDPEEAMFASDRVAVMQQGRIVQVGSPQSLYRKPMNPFVAGFFGDLNCWAFPVSQGIMATPFGQLAVGAVENGMGELFIRQEAISLATAGSGVPARVLRSRFLGGVALVDFVIESSEYKDQGLRLRARLQGSGLPDDQSDCYLKLDDSMAFSFASPLPKAAE